MRSVLGVICAVAVACSSSSEPTPPIDAPVRSFDFGPFTVQAGEEVEDDCVQITLGNTEPVYVNQVELTTGPGFHHSNWLYVPEHIFAGEDGVFRCDDRDYNEAIAAVFGGVLFAQSTQAPHEIQQFPPGVAVKLPPRTKIVAQLHLLNATEAAIDLAPNITITSIPEADVATQLAGVSFQNQSLALPPMKASRFTVECDIGTRHRALFGRAPDFNLYYGLAHYHELGTGLAIEAVRADGTATTVYSTANNVGDVLGGPIAPAFSMVGYEKLRFYCDFYNPRSETVRWGIGDQEMCVFLAFSDSPYHWAGGENNRGAPMNETTVGNAVHYENPCAVFATDASH